jgi:DNA primase
VLEIAGHEVRITSPGKVLFPERGETKLDLIEYYLSVADPLLRTMGGRPVLMQRFPQGAGGPSFFQKRVGEGVPEWLETTTVMTVNGTPSRALVIADLAHVAWAVNMACLGFHVWPYLAADADHTDELRLDLDPQPGTDFGEAAEAAANSSCCSTSSASGPSRRRPATAGCTSTSGSSHAGIRTPFAQRRSRWRASSSAGAPS